MKENIMNYIDTLESYKTYIKTCHWSAKNMSMHKLMDEIAESVAENQDEVAEICQGIYGQLNIKDLKPKSMDFKSPKDMLNGLLKDTNSFYKTIDGETYIGLRSVIEAFLGDLNKFNYLLDLTLKESIKKRLQRGLNENKMHITESNLRALIQKTIKSTILKESKQKNKIKNIVQEVVNQTINGDAEFGGNANDYDEVIKLAKQYGFFFDEEKSQEDELYFDDGWASIISLGKDENNSYYIKTIRASFHSADPANMEKLQNVFELDKHLKSLQYGMG